ncbi:hypothetical protein LZ495_05475 [Yinghuangia sp. KLBMP8922]|uniref:Peptidase inhibitor family I36 n=1 Tax=Yinghuangia soli TaxID=2908204 RepID=A0AA41PW28_9ACTN|nr:hypothetical protein [Yinghuangia soli]
MTAALILGSAALGGTAGAAEPKPSGRSCTENADTGAVVCYSSLEKALAAAGGGIERSNTRAAAAATAYTLAILFKDFNYYGESRVIWNYSGCPTWAGANLTGGWDNVVSSVKVYNSCRLTLWTGQGNGTGVSFTSHTPDVGWINDQASSYDVA